MSDKVARAVNASSPMTVKFGKKECQVSALGIRELTEAERECLRTSKRAFLETYAQNLDLLPNGQQILERKLEEVAKWDVDDLPKKKAYDPQRVKVTNELKTFISEYFDLDLETLNDIRVQRFTAALLDQEQISVDKYKELTKFVIHAQKIAYVNWWITGSYDGMITFIWLCFKKHGITREEVLDKISKSPAMLIELSREIESLSTPAVGNG